MPRTAPVSDWGSDFDVLDPRYLADPFGIWDDLRATSPIAHTERRGSTWLPTRYEDVTAIAHDIDHFSSRKVAVIPMGSGEEGARQLEYGLPPISSDPPLHTWTRRLLLPWLFAAGPAPAGPGDDLLSELLGAEVDGAPLDDGIVLGMAALVLIAGVDTTWSAIGSSLWYLARHPEDQKRLVAEPELMATATEELLRAFAPVTMARVVTGDIDYGGCPMKQGDKVLMNFPAANRDPEVFDRPEAVLLDRAHNRHVAFGSGIHRCAGSNLARMELRVALEEWLSVVPSFALEEGREIVWAGGQVRGPRILPVVFP
jgi:cytochrome P450